MKNINEYTDKELEILHGQFKELKTYVEKVEFVYSYFGRVNGCINKVETDFDFTIKPKDEEENRVRWTTFFEIRKREVFEKLKSDHESRYEKVSDKTRFIEDSLMNVRKIYESNSNLKYGYQMGSLAKNLDFINWEPIHDIYRKDFLEPYYEGFAYYLFEEWLNELKKESGPKYDHDLNDGMMKDGLFNQRVRFVVAHQLGIIEHLEEKVCGTDRVLLADVLSVLFGCKLNGNERDLIYQWVKKYYSEDTSKSPVNKKNMENALRLLSSIGVSPSKLKT
jgi:hypothetical protein